MPHGIFSLDGRAGLRLGQPWKWSLLAAADAGRQTLFAFDSRKREYRIWQASVAQGRQHLTLRLEHHGHRPGWHMHRASGTDADSALLAPRRSVPKDAVPFLDDHGMWRESASERFRALFPMTSIKTADIDTIEAILRAQSEKAVVSPVPFGAAVDLADTTRQGDTLGFYVGQLGSRSPLFRLEDDGTTIPILESAGCLRPDSRLQAWSPDRSGRTADFFFGPDNRALFTPFFPIDELGERAAAFSVLLRQFWQQLHEVEPAHDTAKAHSSWPESAGVAAQ